MDPVLMVGAWAGAVVATVAASRLLTAGFVKLVRAALADEMKKVWRELREQDDWFHDQIAELKKDLNSIHAELKPNGGASLRDTVDRLERMLMEQSDGRK